MELLNNYIKSKEELLKYFGREEDYCDYLIMDHRDYYWNCDNEFCGDILFAMQKENVFEGTMKDGFQEETAKIDSSGKSVLRADGYTMVGIRSSFDVYLAIFDNKKEVKE